MKIEVLAFEGCPNASKTHELVRTALRLEAVKADIEPVNIDSIEAAQKFGFLGSPSVRVNGEDVEAVASAGRPSYGLMCRVYNGATGPTGSPPLEMIRASIRRAASAKPTREK